MIFITGDTHGDWKNRFKPECFPIGQSLNRSDYVIVCGDFGYWHDTDIERNNLDWLENQPWTTLFVDGNHSNFDRLKKLLVEEWNGGKIHKIRPHIIHLMRGQVFTIDGKTFFTFGGAQSHDIRDGILETDDPRIAEWQYDYCKMFRINHISWWQEELPSQKEMDEGIENLVKYGNKVDYIITHCPPTKT